MADLVGVPVEVSGGGLRFPNGLPPPKGGAADPSVPHAPRRNNPLSEAQERLALRNALRYFAPEHHAALAPEFASELRITGHIYVHRLRPDAPRKALPLESYPGECEQARLRLEGHRAKVGTMEKALGDASERLTSAATVAHNWLEQPVH